MTLRLTCLGGSAAWPNPGQGCSSFLVESHDASVLLDSGANTLLELRKHIAYSTLDAIVISHCHADHILDLIPYRYGLTYGPETPERPIPLYLPPGGIQKFDELAQALGGQGEASEDFWTVVFDLQEYDPFQALHIKGMPIRFQRTIHAAECYAMRLENQDGAVLTYTADTGDYEPLIEFARGSDILVSEGTLPESDEQDASAGHLTPSQAGMLAQAANAQRLVISHLWYERPDDVVLSAARSTFFGEILISKPGLVLHV